MKALKITLSALLSLSLALFVACGGSGEEDPATIEQSDAVSDCGGFPATRAPVFDDYPGAYCDAEVLHWEYDEVNQRLDLRNSRILLNCCGDHAMSVTFEEGVYVVTEIDAPEGGDGRCHCMCVFDYDLSATGIPGGEIELALMRHETDQSDEPELIWQGLIDLGAGGGAIVISEEDVGMWCGEYADL